MTLTPTGIARGALSLTRPYGKGRINHFGKRSQFGQIVQNKQGNQPRTQQTSINVFLYFKDSHSSKLDNFKELCILKS